MNRTFYAPWSVSLRVISLVCTLLLPAAAWLVRVPAQPGWLSAVLRALPVLVLAGAALFTVRNYELAGGCLCVRRLFWVTRIPLDALVSAEWLPEGFGGALRLCGNGGLYSFTGWYHQRSIGRFRALATRTTAAVLLRFGNRAPIVVTPDDPPGFVAAVRAAASQVAGKAV